VEKRINEIEVQEYIVHIELNKHARIYIYICKNNNNFATFT
jgi:hypothetical protein